MIITVCIGSCCHIKGSRQVINTLQTLIKANNLEDKVKTVSTFCMDNCKDGVCVNSDGKIFSLTPESTEEFFNSEILSKV